VSAGATGRAGPYLAFMALASVALGLSGCERAVQNMYDQAKYKPLAESTLWADGQSARPLVPGVIVHSGGTWADTSSGRAGLRPVLPAPTTTYPLDEQGKRRANLPEVPKILQNPLPVTLENLQRGRERYDIYCAPCHSPAGDGDGMVARRGFPHPPSYHTERLRRAPDAHFYEAMTNGYGVMYSYADRIEPADRWAIVAYIRALQLSQNARLDDVPESERGKLSGARP
jgi:cytochrome c553